MHKEFRKLLETAIGRSEHVIAINLDIRGFSSFCQEVESFDVGNFIKLVYSKIIDEYFENASFYKSTGDGLIVIISCKKENIRESVNNVVESCLNLVENFSSLVADEAIINFPTPSKIGIGIARGGACCIIEEDQNKILDYSGRILNLASRLMDLARPSGLVISDKLGINLLEKKNRINFLEDTVYLRGVAEKHPTKIHYTKKYTVIDKSYHEPIREPQWKTDLYTYTFALLKQISDQPLTPFLSEKPLDINKIVVEVNYLIPGFKAWFDYSITGKKIRCQKYGNDYFITIDVGAVCKELNKRGVSDDQEIRIEIGYNVK